MTRRTRADGYPTFATFSVGLRRLRAALAKGFRAERAECEALYRRLMSIRGQGRKAMRRTMRERAWSHVRPDIHEGGAGWHIAPALSSAMHPFPVAPGARRRFVEQMTERLAVAWDEAWKLPCGDQDSLGERIDAARLQLEYVNHYNATRD